MPRVPERSVRPAPLSAWKWKASATPPTAASFASASCRRRRAITLLGHLPPGRLREEHTPAHSTPPTATGAACARRSAISVALHLGRHRRALFLQRHHGILADGLAARSASSVPRLERLHRLKINRMRVLLAGRSWTILRRAGHDRPRTSPSSCAPGPPRRPRTSTIPASTTPASTSRTGRSGSACCASRATAT